MNKSAPQSHTSAGWRAHRVRDGLLGALALAAGAVDALTWLALGKVFSAFMTGNVVFIAVGVSSHKLSLALHAAIAICAFGVGAWSAAALIPRPDPSVLWPTSVTFGIAAGALVQLVFWIFWLVVGGHPDSSLIPLLAISAFAMGIQTATAVALGVHAVFTTAATATWTVLVGDSAHWSSTRIERRRLALVLVGTLLGALAGSLLLAHARLWMPLLPVLLTAGVAAIAHRSIEGHVDADRASVSAAPHPAERAFGRSPAGEHTPVVARSPEVERSPAVANH
jgi:uncharacterized membrane protein YoaK (UPF0700 family)